MDFFMCGFLPIGYEFFWGACEAYIGAETLSVSPECKVVAIILSKREEKGHQVSHRIVSTGRQPATERHPSPYPDVRGLLKSHLSSRRARVTDRDCGKAILDSSLF
jgi:hypothetical protein